MAKLYGIILKKGEEAKKADEAYLYQLNINARDLNSKKGEDVYEVRSKYSNEALIDKFSIHVKNVEYYRNLYYNNMKNLQKDSYG